MMYGEEDLLSLSGIQHYYFCKRQWALIHIEQQWAENRATMEGQVLHEKADDPFLVESRKNMFISRAIPLVSYKLGFSGIADIVEFKSSKVGIEVKERKGKWIPNIVEYKHGKPKEDDRDIVQLVAQALCIEEMLGCKLNSSDLFYNVTKRRIKVEINDDLRNKVIGISMEMHKVYDGKVTPKAEVGKHCKSCSLVDICMPRLTSKKVSVANYIEKYINRGSDEN
ncbi:CRISPR-associated protein Cas4 [Clostridium sp.]|uniref:CRISPR-associated protein Cas4 n=1 Tax=Clostridium sp. TaxID=1506 RepID=UPI003D6CD186